MSESQQKERGYLHGAAILATAVAIVKLLGALYRIPLGNILGADGFSTFTVAHSIYAFLLVLSTAGLPVALSKLIATADALGRPRQVRQIFVIGRNAFFALGVICFLIMAVFHQQLANLSNSPTSAYAILALSPAILFVCLLAVYRGYFQGFSNMVPTSVSQVIEAAIRLILGLGFAWFFMYYFDSVAITVAGAILGVTIGTGIAALYMFLVRRKWEHRHISKQNELDTPDSNRRIFKNLLNFAIPLSLGASILSIVAIIDNAIILGRLQDVFQSVRGYDYATAYDTARNLHGTYAFTMTLFNLPSSFIIPITVALIPAISATLARGETPLARKTSESGIRVTCLLALPAGAGLVVLAAPIMHVLFGEVAAEGQWLMIYMGIAAFFICFFQVTNCILQAYGHQRYTVYTLTVGGIVKIALNWVLLGNPNIHIYGAAISTLACYAVISAMNIYLVKRNIPDPPKFMRVLARPLICTAAMGAAAWATHGLLASLVSAVMPNLHERIRITAVTFGAIGIAMIVYLILIIAMRALTMEDMKMLPRGEKLAKILKIR